MYDAHIDHHAPRVSVVMPVHNAARFLATTLASVQAQSMPDWELVAVDDGSTDGSAEILAEAAKHDTRIRPASTHDSHGKGSKGAGVARNLGMDIATGRYVAFLDADDLWHPDKLELHLGWLESQSLVAAKEDRGSASSVALSFTAYQRVEMDAGATAAMFDGVGVPDSISYVQLLATNVIGCSTVILDRSILGEMRMPKLRLRQDFAFWLNILQKHGPGRGLPLALTTYRRHIGQMSGDKRTAARATWAMYRDELNFGRIKASWYFSRYALQGILRHRAPGLARTFGLLQNPIQPGSSEAICHELLARGQPVLTVAIATTSVRLRQIDIAALPALQGVTYQVFVQGVEPNEMPPSPRADVRLTASNGHGAARNRNAALQSVTTPLLLFADDDLQFEPAGLKALISRFAALPDADFVCARIGDESGNPRKRYSLDAVPVRWWNSAKTGTPELALRPERFRARNIWFDEAFGAGMPDYLGDEYIFLCDAMRAGLRGMHVALVLARHDTDSSGTRNSAHSMAIRKTVLIRALGSRKSRFARLAFAVRHWRSFPDLRSFLRFL